MLKHKARHAVSAAVAAVILMAACEAGAEDLEATLTRLSGAACASQREPVSGFGLMATPIAIERHHFEIYNNYRAMFERAPDIAPVDGNGASDDGPQSAGAARDGIGPAGAASSCSQHMLLSGE